MSVAGLRIPPVAGLIAILFVASSTAAVQPCFQQQDTLLVPWGPFSPPPFVDETMELALLVRYIDDPIGKTYDLYPNGPPSSLCIGSNPCTPHRIVVPDFNVAWYDLNGVLLEDHDAAGPDSGSIPVGTEFGVVYLRYGPDGTGDGNIFAEFNYDEYC